MNMIVKLVLPLVVLVALPGGRHAIGHADFLDRQLASNKFQVANHFDNSLGFDNFTDNFYTEFKTEAGRNIDLVNVHYERKNFLDVKITESSQSTSGSSDGSSLIHYDFAVAQKSFSDWATFNDRWDLKVNTFGHQFIGLYHGTDPFVTNRMRSYMLRWIGNGVKDYLPIFDETVSKFKDHLEIVETELSNVIQYIIMRLHTKIKNLWYDMDYFDAHESQGKSGASNGGSIVIVSGNYIIVVNMGDGRVLSCDDTGTIRDMTAKHERRDQSLFMSGESSVGPPFIYIQPKHFKSEDGSDRMIKFVILESATVAELVDQNELSEIVQSQLKEEKPEQELYSAIANQAIQRLTDKLNSVVDKSTKLDHSFVVVGLERKNNTTINT